MSIIRLGVRQKSIHDLLQADFVNAGSTVLVLMSYFGNEGLFGLGKVLLTNAITPHLESIADEHYQSIDNYFRFQINISTSLSLKENSLSLYLGQN